MREHDDDSNREKKKANRSKQYRGILKFVNVKTTILVPGWPTSEGIQKWNFVLLIMSRDAKVPVFGVFNLME